MKWFVLLLLVAGCNPEPDVQTYPAGPAACPDGARRPAAAVERQLATVGTNVNAMRRAGDEAFLVESGDNTVSRLDLRTGGWSPLVDVGNGRGPWDLAVTDDEIWITNFVANTVTVADRATGEVLTELADPAFEGPSGVAVLGDRVYVSSVQFRGEGDYGPGAVHVIDRPSRRVLGSLATARQNPQALDAVDGRLVVVDSGSFSFDGTFVAGSEAAVEIWTPTSTPLEPDIIVLPLAAGSDAAVGTPGRPAHRSGSPIIYLPSATAPVVFALDLNAGTWVRGGDDPIVLYETDRDALHHAALGEDGLLYVTAFNEDELILVDTSCDAVLARIPLETSSMLAGPHGVIPYGDAAYFVLALAAELGRVTLTAGEADD